MKKYLFYFFYITFPVCIFFSGCASPRVAFKQGYDFTRIKVVKIGEITPATKKSNSGAVIANEFIRQLLAAGYTVKTADDGAYDVVLEGNVTEYLPNNRYLIQTNKADGATKVVVINQPVELSGTNAYNLGSAFGLGEDSRVVVSNATVGVSAFLRDAVTGEVVWSNTYSYEGLDLTTAMEGVVRYLLRSWPVKR
ncbi:MAG: hypothetical protein A2219_04615 [Elusimicrobia bacterium RIFOXYA2_FULL_50_26]|nr:MAG: hypothetical protein A2219_04615 [Elusimicrobia bacterium RIFOXYA2_FULL_50_26]OGS23695.1 MAG: hypothetical protein A2314_01165 [Elusimicrobia bacterium RIFOXYB2_FULL_50_12]